ncbi:MAG: signal peptide peptidase SppA [Alphaproteobacteria bacterium]|nr:signal peptide peptidase SppA [Alphaproteobacteria bacterium]
MSLDADAILDRRRLKRRLTLWRLAALAAVITLAFIALFRVDLITGRDHIAEIGVTGLIVDDDLRSELLQRVAENGRAKALIVNIDSPGGTTIGGESLYHDIRLVAERKPVVGVVKTVGTSAAYLVAAATDHIVAGESSLTGSIGVLIQTAQFTGLLEKIGVSAEAIKSSPLKSVPSPLEPMTDEARDATQAVIDDTHAWFVDIIANRRNLAADRIQQVADGRLFTGRQALQLGLIDEVGGRRQAREWLSKTHNLSTALPLLKIEIDNSKRRLIERFMSVIGKTTLSERLTLDGLISLWHPQSVF